jgi:DNA-binding LacI/PurR family transcriptional regulator
MQSALLIRSQRALRAYRSFGVAGSMVTIYDVAREAGVNHTTVSHAFSGKRSVAPSTWERVVEAAWKLGFHANAAARPLASRKTHIIGLAAPLDLPMRALAEGSF